MMQRQRKVCGHCNKELSEKAYKEHFKLYFHGSHWVTVTDLSRKAQIPDQEDGSKSRSTTPISVPEATTEKLDSGSSVNLDGNQNTSDSDMDYIGNQEEPVLEFWTESDKELDEDFPSNTSDIDEPEDLDHDNLEAEHQELDNQQSALLRWVVLFTCVFQTLHRIPLAAVQWLLKFLGVLLTFLGKFSPAIATMARKFPDSIYLRGKYIEQVLPTPKINRKVVCCHCHALYNLCDCLEKRGTRTLVKSCMNCKSKLPLLRTVVTRSGKNMHYPFLVYPFVCLTEVLQWYFEQPEFWKQCEKWRECVSMDSSILNDCFDGTVWKNLLADDGSIFFALPFSIGLILNIDWFQPYKHRSYSVGVIFLAFLNLPRAIRYKRENIIIVGLIPGPEKPHLDVNSYLTPLVCELLSLWKGVSFRLPNKSSEIITCALVCVSCDLPAGRQVCGFLATSANYGCSRCYKSFFTGTFGHNDYSGFDRSSWIYRTNSKHRDDVKEILKCQTKTSRSQKESELGCRYSSLLQLPYFDPVKMLVIDPMHNLYIGTAKHIFHDIWVKHGIITKQLLGIINDRISKLHIPSHISFNRLPNCIDQRNAYTGEQWMLWVNFYSLYCLQDIIPDDHYQCWHKFVLASRLLCQCALTEAEISLADAFLLQFCRSYERLYGASAVTPNIHIHCHLAECVRDFGPLSSFWLFTFERFNGILGDQPTNNRSIELQLMQRFVDDNTHYKLLSMCPNSDIDDEMNVFLNIVKQHALSFCSAKHLDTHLSHSVEHTTSNFQYVPCHKYTIGVFSQSQLNILSDVYYSLYPSLSHPSGSLVLPNVYKKMCYVHIGGQRINAGDLVLAKPVFDFPSMHNTYPETVFVNPNLRVAKIHHFSIHSFSLTDQSESFISHAFAIVDWYSSHPQRQRFGTPLQVWCYSFFEPDSKNFLLPLENISSAVLHAEYILPDTNEKVLVTVPCL